MMNLYYVHTCELRDAKRIYQVVAQTAKQAKDIITLHYQICPKYITSVTLEKEEV